MRVVGIDVLRIVAALFVIIIHVPIDTPDASLVIKSAARWAVPCFFMVTGYFLKGEGLPEVSGRQVAKIAVITLVASLLFLPIGLITSSGKILSPLVLVNGVYNHLWFLSSMLFGLGALRLLATVRVGAPVAICMGLVFWAGYLVIDLAVALGTPGLDVTLTILRFLQSVPMILLGHRLARISRGASASPGPLPYGLVFGGLAFTIAEVFYLFGNQNDGANPQLPLGTGALAAGLLLFAATLPATRLTEWLAQLGRRYALLIYILHPALTLAMRVAFKSTGLLAGETLGRAALAYGVAATGAFAAAVVIHRFMPPAYALLHGELPWARRARSA